MLTPAQTEFVERVRAASVELAGTPELRRRITADDTVRNSDEAFALFADRELLGVSFPREDGGPGRTFTEECLLLEETERLGVPIAAYSTSLTAAQTYLKWGSAGQRREIVRTVRSGAGVSVTFTEPGAGSDLSAVATRAARDGDGWRLDGRKTYISFADRARYLTVLARTDPDAGRHGGLTIFMVPADAAGVTIRPIPTMGAPVITDVGLDGVRLPAEAVIGRVGDAWDHISRGLGIERLIIAAMSLGAAQRAFDQVLDHVRLREQFGKPIGRNQAVRHRIADLATEIAHVRAFVSALAERVDAGAEEDLMRHAAMAKLKATEVAKSTALEGMQLMGGAGYLTSNGMEQQLRAALAPPIYGGTNEIQREIIGRSLGL